MHGASDDSDRRADEPTRALSPAQLAAQVVAEQTASGICSGGDPKGRPAGRARRRKAARVSRIVYAAAGLSLIAVAAGVALLWPDALGLGKAPTPPEAPPARKEPGKPGQANAQLVSRPVPQER